VTMSRFIAAAGAIALTASLLVGSAAAQSPYVQPGARASVGPIGLLDVQKVFEKHARFKQMMDGLEQDIQRIDEWIKAERESLRTMNEELKQYKPGSPDFRQKEQQIAERMSRLQAQVQIQKRDVIQKKAKIHYIVFSEVRDEVASIAAARGLIAVMQYNSQKVNSEDPEDIIRDLNSLIVYHAPGIDITQEVLDNLARRMPYNGAAPAGGTASQTGIPAPPRR